MRKIAATYVFPIHQPPLKNGIVILDNDGTILDILDTKGKLSEQANLEYYNGILIPGFINAHCHTELSFLHNRIPEQLGLPGFLGEINKLRNEEILDKEEKIRQVDKDLFRQGINAVGDISNSIDSIWVKRNSRITYHTFVEAFGFSLLRAEKAFGIAENIYNILKSYNLPASVTPHSPYSVSDKLFQLIKDHAELNQSIFSIHNQESNDENEFFLSGKGGISNHLQNNIGLDISEWKPTGKNSLPSIIKHLPQNCHQLFVHNTFTSGDDLISLKNKRNPKNLFFVICPNSNLYIENKLPPIDLFRDEKLSICLGTDSLASNKELSMIAEMNTIQQHFPAISLHEILSWGTINGAKALKLDKILGTFEPGKKPGVNLLTGVDLINLKLNSQSKIKRLL